MPEYLDFFGLAGRYDRVHLDTTMDFTDFTDFADFADFTDARMPLPVQDRARLLDLQDRIVLGTDFPNIPYPFAHQVEALPRLDLGDDWPRAVLHDNAPHLLGVTTGGR